MSDELDIPEPDVSEEHPVSEHWIWVGPHRPPSPRVLFDHMTSGLGARRGAERRASRREPLGERAVMRLAARFPDQTIVVPTGNFKVRANDTDYPFRAGTDFFYLTGCEEPDAVLVITPGEAPARRSTFRTVATRARTSSTPTRATASCGWARVAALSRLRSTTTSRRCRSRTSRSISSRSARRTIITLRGFDARD